MFKDFIKKNKGLLGALALALTAALQALPLWIFRGAAPEPLFRVAALQTAWSLPFLIPAYFLAKALAGHEREEAQRWKS